MDKQPHIPVLLQEVSEGLALQAGETLVDGTLGLGGHSKELCPALGGNGLLIGIDADADALKLAEQNLKLCPGRKILINSNFRRLREILEEQGLKTVDAILLDLGFNSVQMDSSGRGFSFQRDEPLDMTFAGQGKQSLSVADLLNTLGADGLADIIYAYGEETFARKIARQIVADREHKPFVTTFDLVKSIETAVPFWYKHRRLHFATKTFQALRIAVNDELEALQEVLVAGFRALNHGGRFAVISFHSLEARIVKNFFNDLVKSEQAVKVNKKAIKPTQAEIIANPRSRSSSLRIIKKI